MPAGNRLDVYDHLYEQIRHDGLAALALGAGEETLHLRDELATEIRGSETWSDMRLMG